MRSMMLFHRDLRLEDNQVFLRAAQDSSLIFPVFIFDEQQIYKNEYRGDMFLHFFLESLQDLDRSLALQGGKLNIFCGNTAKILAQYIQKYSLEAVYSHFDYTPFAQKRDALIHDVCQKMGIAFIQFHDVVLHQPDTILKSDGTPYTVFTPYYKKWAEVPASEPISDIPVRDYLVADERFSSDQMALYLGLAPQKSIFKGGRTAALARCKHIQELQNYQQTRDLPMLDGTTKLSPYLKAGCISAREFYFFVSSCFGPDHGLIRELAWRDFYTQIAFHFPHVFGSAFRSQYDQIPWENDPSKFQKWCDGITGFPIVDAGMRELNATGFMHNRVRMIVSSFLVKDLHIDWRWGEKYFAQKLVDYDPSVNNGSWQWSASTGCDAQPYFRIFNPWLQQKKFDPDLIYVKKWVQELEGIPNQMIHTWYESTLICDHYPKPIIDHKQASERVKAMFREIGDMN